MIRGRFNGSSNQLIAIVTAGTIVYGLLKDNKKRKTRRMLQTEFLFVAVVC
jgi:hypothetical protein